MLAGAGQVATDATQIFEVPPSKVLLCFQLVDLRAFAGVHSCSVTVHMIVMKKMTYIERRLLAPVRQIMTS